MGFEIARDRPHLLMHAQVRRKNLLYLVLTAQLTMFAIFYHVMYPVEYPFTGIIGASGYWVLVLSIIVVTAAIAYFGRSAASSFIATLVFYLVLNSYQILSYSIVGGDVTSQIRELSLMTRYANVSPGISPHFDYLSWPANYLFALSIKELHAIDSVITTVSIGYAVYFFLFTLAVWLFAFRLGDGFAAYIGSVSYLMLAFTALNNQFVPQFMALVFLVFLFSVIDKRGLKWRVIEGTLFIAMVFTHLLFPVIYLLTLAVRPAVTGMWDQYRDEAAYSKVYQAFRHPVGFLRRLFSYDTWVSGGRAVYARATALGIVYLVYNPPGFLLSTVFGPHGTTAGNPVLVILSDLGILGSSSVGTQRYPLVELVPAWLDLTVTWGSRILVVILFGVLVLSFLNNGLASFGRSWHPRECRLEILVASLMMFVIAVALETTYGTRLLQTAFLPIALGFYGLRNHRRKVMIVILLLALASPLLLANGYVNMTLSAGGNSLGQSETVAGETMGTYYDDAESVIVPPHTPYPAGTVNNSGNMDVRLVADGDATPKAGLMVYSDRLTGYLDHRGYTCEIRPDTMNIIYDNGPAGAQVGWLPPDDKALTCLREGHPEISS